MARTKQTARKSISDEAPRKQLSTDRPLSQRELQKKFKYLQEVARQDQTVAVDESNDITASLEASLDKSLEKMAVELEISLLTKMLLMRKQFVESLQPRLPESLRNDSPVVTVTADNIEARIHKLREAA